MICPIMSRPAEKEPSLSGPRVGVEVFFVTCKEGKCTWWDDDQNRCFVPVIAVNLEALRSTIEIKA